MLEAAGLVKGINFDTQITENTEEGRLRPDVYVYTPDEGVIVIDSKAPKIGISPFIGNKTIKGPANKMMKELGKVPNALGFVEMYYDILDLFIIDKSDKNLQKPIYKLISNVFLSDILMKNQNDKLRLAKEILNVSEKLFCD